MLFIPFGQVDEFAIYRVDDRNDGCRECHDPVVIRGIVLAMLTSLTAFIHDEHGATMIEYALMVAFIALVCFVAVVALGQSVLGLFSGAIDGN